MPAVTPQKLATAARMNRGFGYLVGVVGSAAGTLLLWQSTALAAAATWAATFVAGAVLVGVATLLDGIAAVLNTRTGTEPDGTSPA